MDVRWPAALLLVSLLAGCSDGKTKGGAETTDFGELEPEATETTGVIRGIVVDERIVPIDGAEVILGGQAAAQQTTSDDQGRFAFSDLPPGVYFLAVKHALYHETQTTVEVVAGVSDPPITKVLLQRRFSQEPFIAKQEHNGFIQCNQGGVVYGSAPCVTDFTGLAWSQQGIVPPQCVPAVRCCTAAGCAPELRRIQTENRGFTVGLGEGWQTLIWDMVWRESSDTFQRLGLTISYNETERCACHNFASVPSQSPLRLQIDVGEDHDTSADNAPDLIPPEGLPAMYYFVGARTGGQTAPVAIAVNQAFQLFAHFFHYGVPPEGWSFANNDPYPF